MLNNWLVTLALILETSGMVGLLSPEAGDLHLAAYLFAHAIACAILAIVLLPLLPARYRGQPVRAGVFLFTLQFAIPFIGSVGLLLGILLALYLPRSQREIPWQEVDIPELPFQPIDMNLQVIYSQGGLRQVLREASSTDKRLRAMMATRQMNDRDAIDILREALKDPADDVRLLAYSMLEQKEKTLTHRAGLLQQSLQKAGDMESVLLQRRLAQVWWEMAYLGLAQGSLREYYLTSARKLLLRLVNRRSQHNDWRLLGRVELALGNVDQAEEAFNAALDGGSAPEMIMPYLGEVAFLQRDFVKVRERLSACPPERYHPANRPIIEAWL
ncbi:HEAT repeat domain-containing protein [Marinobacter confluentis]|uniref:Polysaccharide biosynthesis protein n=1 Tax=Marinobacter confluentis TaxID=1697557 RepID=A0A4Z1CG84_9GAMM|nr:HEAT repeat domain-containing protein [Marinobacter confluentis]TGN39244.1 polysaccharide biosynthesis protein [Marinobacter confluentis]